jgi:serine/threonine-protein kinase
VTAGLPGGDPLAAAVAAGETPSPRLVADAPVEGTLRPLVAGAMFLGVVACLLLIAGLNDRYKAHRHVPLPPPAVLEEKARALVRDLGYTDPPADTAGSFEMPAEHQLYMARHGSQPAVTLDQMPLCRPPLAVYWHRQSPRPLAPVRHTELGRQDRLTSANPPADEPGMVTVKIDTRGRLIGFLAVPDPAAAPPPNPVGWDALLKAAELDAPGALRPDPAAAPTPPVFADRTAAWDGTYPDRPDLAIRVEAASYRGRPVYFRVTHPDWGEPPPDRPNPLSILSRSSEYVVVFGVVAGVLTAALLGFAVRNVRRGRADLRGAVILAATVVALVMVFKLLVTAHFSGPGLVFPQFVHALEPALLAAGFATAGYLALEPVMRRRCPHRLTAWTRLTGGRWRDPLVGRDVLIGVLLGVACSLDLPALPFYPSHLGPTVVHPDSFTRPVGDLADLAAASTSMILIWAGTFAMSLAVARREWIAFAILAVILLTFVVLGSGRPPLNVVFQCMRRSSH